MNSYTFAPSKAPLRTVESIRFGILSPEEIVNSLDAFLTLILFFQKAMSVAKIELPELYDETGHKPKMGGLLDPRMGTVDRNYRCQMCGEGMSECNGHFGHIELARPVYHIGRTFTLLTNCSS